MQVNRNLRYEYDKALHDFTREMRRIAHEAKDDPLLRARALLTIVKCNPNIRASIILTENNIFGTPPAYPGIVVAECIVALVEIMKNANARESEEIAKLIDELSKVFG